MVQRDKWGIKLDKQSSVHYARNVRDCSVHISLLFSLPIQISNTQKPVLSHAESLFDKAAPGSQIMRRSPCMRLLAILITNSLSRWLLPSGETRVVAPCLVALPVMCIGIMGGGDCPFDFSQLLLCDSLYFALALFGA